MAGVVEGISLPFQEAVRFFEGKTRIPTTAWHEVWREAHARGFMVAGATNDALLKDFQSAIQGALKDGTAFGEFRQTFDALVKKYGWAHTGAPGWRASIIYDTNLASAYAAGRYVQATDPEVLKAFPYWQYRHTSCAHPRLLHLAWDGLTLRADDPWWDTHYPPNGWRCGCRVSAVSEGGLARMGKRGPDTAPPVVTRPWVNPKTGAVHQVPAGIDPGFDWNPGKAWQQGRGADGPLHASPLRALERAPAVTRAQLDAIARFVARPEGEIVVGKIGPEVKAALGARTDEVTLSAETMMKQRARHAETPLTDYQLLPLAVAQPDVVVAQTARRVVLLRTGARVLRVVVKTTVGGDGNYVISLHRMGEESLRRFLKSARVVWGDAGKLLP